ncbi:Immunoglobulin subtype,Immunoglobulin-like domain,Immunoglobulin-like fold,Immunoglobulin subtype [Cinara cedri]|uniref:Immunoglobulin subtype,Immunoglobulin-like domain,Immunoglobulin-like fold,Immunoglobulin subtype n=1 Tax=Cinara cedri TaxID=506608 RepID=A0A5E4NE03_9HEMI|nr:Immunoglobulin subtype,Immunoglobulin-like domain,Immunoglobulin-like fold,Immunoglobulin subtype [Cinara cedri]
MNKIIFKYKYVTDNNLYRLLKFYLIHVIHVCHKKQVLSMLVPEFAEPIPNVTIPVGRPVSLPCVVRNLGSFQVAWLHIERKMILTVHKHVIARIPRFSMSHDGQMTWLLHIDRVMASDKGIYMCQVNTVPMISQIGYLQVVVPPNIVDDESSSSTVAVREGLNASLTCKAKGNPEPRIVWKRENGFNITVDKRKKVEKHYGNVLNLTKVTRADMGSYLCIASNGVPPSVSKRIVLDVEFSPSLVVPNQLVGAPLGTDVTIDCLIEAYPKPINYWIFEEPRSRTMLFQASKHNIIVTENGYKSHMKLIIKSLSQKDYGNYKCVTKNSLGESEGSMRIYEITRPFSNPKSTSGLLNGAAASHNDLYGEHLFLLLSAYTLTSWPHI